MCCDISNYFVKNASFCQFVRGRVFFRFFNFVKNAQFCHFLRGPCGFSLFQNCQKWPILSLSERLVYFFASSILSNMLNFVIFLEASERSREKWIFSTYTSIKLSKMLNFVIFWEGRNTVFFSLFQFCHKMVHFVIFEKWISSNYEID